MYSSTSLFFSALPDYLEKQSQVILYYTGPLSRSTIKTLGQSIKDQLADAPIAAWKVFAIFMELVQNMQQYSQESVNYQDHEDCVGTIYIYETVTDYHIITANLSSTRSFERLQSRCQHINNLSQIELRQYKNTLRDVSVDEQLRSGNIGLVQAALYSQNPFTWEAYPLSGGEHVFFSLKTSIPKSEN